MKVIESITDILEYRCQITGTVGFVPTMGYLHEGHISLVRRAKGENDSVVVSIFVNPTQFGPREDFHKYPRDISRDLTMLKPFTNVVFIPPASEMYPDNYNTWVEVNDITEPLEGALRPGHFRGVATIVTKLFNIVQPTRAYFGQKDAQQLLVIKKIATDLNMNLEVIACPTVREPDGLAMSSRNTYLTSKQRQAATVLYRALTLANRMWQSGEKNAEEIRISMKELIQKEPLADILYISIAETPTLKECHHHIKSPALVSLAVIIGHIRLIDNIVLE